jgi:hypothetical protein
VEQRFETPFAFNAAGDGEGGFFSKPINWLWIGLGVASRTDLRQTTRTTTTRRRRRHRPSHLAKRRVLPQYDAPLGL